MSGWWKKWGLGKRGKLRSITDNGRDVFISDVCDEVVPLWTLGYEAAEVARA